MRQADLDALLAPHGLTVLGTFAPKPSDGLDAASLALIGPSGPDFWGIVTASPEFGDGAPDPVDRWSRRILDGLAAEVGATALYPFGGPPWHPFIDWAQRTGRIHASPVTLLVHDTHGLFVSFRGALALPEPLTDTAHPGPSPCLTCPDQPCRAACPVTALTADGYDVPACHAHLDTPQGADCLQGCLVRRACPVGSGLRPSAQSAYHMARFHPRTR